MSNVQTKPPVRKANERPVSNIIMLIAAIAAGFVGGYFGGQGGNGNLGSQSAEVRQQIVSSESQVISEIAKNVGPSVVSVNVVSESMRTQDFFGFGGSVEQQSAGTGIIISEDVIITNRHVVPANATNVSVTLSDGTELDNISVIGRTSEGDSLDIAFLKINDRKGKQLTIAKVGDSSKVQVGDKVVAIGNALGRFQNTVTSGIISGYGRDVEVGDETGSTESLVNLFQTDTAINQGNSGGPLVNMSGEVIGINTAAAAGGSENIGFAIPINDVQGLIKSVLETGKLLRPYLGIRYVSLTDDYAYEFNLPVDRGAYIAPARPGQPSILPGSPAEKAGLREKDIITKVNDVAVDEKNSLVSMLGRHSVGDKVKLTVLRDGNEMTINATLEVAPER